MQILRFSLIVYESCNWETSSTLISPDAIIFSRALTFSSVVRVSYCRDPTYCSLGALDLFTLGTYDGTDIGSTEGSTQLTTGGNNEGLLLGYFLGYINKLGKKINELELSYGKFLGRTLGDMVKI